MKQLYRNFDDDDVMDFETYGDHVYAMTSEQLHSKAEIAAELAFRDQQIIELKTKLSTYEQG